MEDALNISNRQKEFIISYTEGKSISQIAKEMSVSRTTLYLWLKDKNIINAINRLNKEKKDTVISNMLEKATDYVKKLDDLIENTENEEIKLNAIIYILDKVINCNSENKEIFDTVGLTDLSKKILGV